MRFAFSVLKALYRPAFHIDKGCFCVPLRRGRCLGCNLTKGPTCLPKTNVPRTFFHLFLPLSTFVCIYILFNCLFSLSLWSNYLFSLSIWHPISMSLFLYYLGKLSLVSLHFSVNFKRARDIYKQERYT